MAKFKSIETYHLKGRGTGITVINNRDREGDNRFKDIIGQYVEIDDRVYYVKQVQCDGGYTTFKNESITLLIRD